jgi:phage gp45-like
MKFAIDQFQSKILKELDSVYTKRQLQLKQTLSNIKNGNFDKLSDESLNDLFHLSEYGPASLISNFAYETIYYLD